MALVENANTGEMQNVKVGDWVCFKCDIEQSGRIKAIRGNTLCLESEDGFEGEYIGGQTRHNEMASDCWIEG